MGGASSNKKLANIFCQGFVLEEEHGGSTIKDLFKGWDHPLQFGGRKEIPSGGKTDVNNGLHVNNDTGGNHVLHVNKAEEEMLQNLKVSAAALCDLVSAPKPR